LAEALSHLRAGDCLVVWKLDRLGRTLRGLIHFIAELRDRAWISVLLTAPARLTLAPHRAGSFSMSWRRLRDLIRERTNAGLAAARAAAMVRARQR
jgi:DNA invertase Pin-like site-specific DNA recombinase